MQIITELSRWTMCARCCHTGVIFLCCPGAGGEECTHQVRTAPCPDCHGTGWRDLEENHDDHED